MTGPTTPSTTPAAPATVAEDVMLLLFDPRSGAIAGEGTLFYTLAGAVLAELALQGRAEVEESSRLRGPVVHAVAGDPPADGLLAETWQLVHARPRGVQTVLAAVGPGLREPVLDRLVEHGHLQRSERRLLGVIPSSRLLDGGTGRREELVAEVRQVLVDGAPPAPRTAVLGALLSASGSLPTLHRDIPWSGAVHARGKQLEDGDWGAAAVGAAVTRTVSAIALPGVVVGAAAGRGG